jgi:hypothetical protein
MAESELAQYVGNSVRNALETRIPSGGSKSQEGGRIKAQCCCQSSSTTASTRTPPQQEQQAKKRGCPAKAQQEAQPQTKRPRGRPPGSKNKKGLRFLEIKALA